MKLLKNKHNCLRTHFNLINKDIDYNCLPSIYWLPKMHKSPSGARFIIASKKCITKQLSKHITSVFKLCFIQIENYNKKTHYFSGVKSFWVIQNNNIPLECIEKINKRKNAKQVSTFDFSTLYTMIPHDKLLKVLYNVIDFAFKGGTKEIITIDNNGIASWSSQRRNQKYFFTKSLIKEAIKHLIPNCFFNFGNLALRQIIGIPVGSDLAPFFANLFLSYYEGKWVNQERKLYVLNKRKINNTYRFIDDIFEQNHHQIYPKELVLKKENADKSEATFLDISIKVENGLFVTKLFDKRDHFGFDIVRMPFNSSNIPSKTFYGTIGAECLRIARATSKIEDLAVSGKQLLNRMSNQDANKTKMKEVLLRTITKHNKVFDKYQMTPNNILTHFGL